MQNKEKVNTGDKIFEFIQKNRKGILIIISSVIILFVAAIVFIAVSEQINKKAIAAVEEMKIEFDDLISKITANENSSVNDIEDIKIEDTSAKYKTAEFNALLEKLLTFSGKNSGFAGSKAWSLIAQIYSLREDWVNAEDAWLNCARVGNKTYLAPIAFFNAAAAAEEQGKIETAIEHFKKCVAHKFEFPDAPRAQFNIGRLYEQLGNETHALSAYRDVQINWTWEKTSSSNPSILIWQNLARNRIILLEGK